jgi:hypothetical protein
MPNVLTHLGLGDHILCCGLVRAVAERSLGQVVTWAKPHNLESVRFLFADMQRIEVRPIIDRLHTSGELLVVGYNNLDRSIPFDQSFYQSAGVPFEQRWSGFTPVSDMGREWQVYHDLGVCGPYAFVHDDPERGMEIGPRCTELPVVRPIKGLTNNILDYRLLIRNAAEVHVIPSSFGVLADSMDLHQPLFWYKRLRSYPDTEHPTLRNQWTILA